MRMLPVSNHIGNVPLLSSLEVSPFCERGFLVVALGFAWSAALRSPKGAALGAQRKAKLRAAGAAAIAHAVWKDLCNECTEAPLLL